jgi:hypothetical protein
MTMKAGREARNADFIIIAAGDTTTLTAAGCVKPKNPWADRPIKPRPVRAVNLQKRPRPRSFLPFSRLYFSVSRPHS